MEECELLRERFNAITAKHRIQQDIHQKKLELDQEKLKLQHLRKKTLKEQWLLQDSQQKDPMFDYNQTRVLQLCIHRIEKEVECLERQESMISANEGFILNRLKALEKSPDDIIKEANESFVLEPLQVTEVIPGGLDVLNPAANDYDEPNRQERESDNQRCTSLQTAQEVEQSPGGATVYCQIKHQNYHQNPNRRKERVLPHHRDERDQGGHYRNYVLRRSSAETDCNSREHWKRKPHDELCYCHHFVNQNGQGHHHGNRRDYNYSQHSNSMSRSRSLINGSSYSRQLPQRSHDQEETTAGQHIPDDVIHPLYCQTPPSSKAKRAPSPLLAEDSPYTILTSLQTTEPITAIFMGFQTAQDDSGQVQEFEGVLKAELIIIQDNENPGEDRIMKAMTDRLQDPTGHSASRNVRVVEGGEGRWKERQLGVRKIKKRHKPCCSVC